MSSFEEKEMEKTVSSMDGDDFLKQLLVAEQIAAHVGVTGWDEFYEKVGNPEDLANADEEEYYETIDIDHPVVVAFRTNKVLQKFLHKVWQLWKNSCDVLNNDMHTASQKNAVTEALRSKEWQQWDWEDVESFVHFARKFPVCDGNAEGPAAEIPGLEAFLAHHPGIEAYLDPSYVLIEAAAMVALPAGTVPCGAPIAGPWVSARIFGGANAAHAYAGWARGQTNVARTAVISAGGANPLTTYN